MSKRITWQVKQYIHTVLFYYAPSGVASELCTQRTFCEQVLFLM